MVYGGVLTRYTQDKFAEWLYGKYDKDKLDQFTFLYAIPGIRDYMDYLLDSRADQEYMERYGLDYSDIHDPRKLRATSSGASYYGNAYRMISRNVDRLYK